jgi:hypothetical protein
MRVRKPNRPLTNADGTSSALAVLVQMADLSGSAMQMSPLATPSRKRRIGSVLIR